MTATPEGWARKCTSCGHVDMRQTWQTRQQAELHGAPGWVRRLGEGGQPSEDARGRPTCPECGSLQLEAIDLAGHGG